MGTGTWPELASHPLCGVDTVPVPQHSQAKLSAEPKAAIASRERSQMPAGLCWAESLPHLNSPLMPSLSLELYSGTTVWVWSVWGSCAGGLAELFVWIFQTGLGIEDVGVEVKPGLLTGSEGLIPSAVVSTGQYLEAGVPGGAESRGVGWKGGWKGTGRGTEKEKQGLF